MQLCLVHTYELLSQLHLKLEQQILTLGFNIVSAMKQC